MIERILTHPIVLEQVNPFSLYLMFLMKAVTIAFTIFLIILVRFYIKKIFFGTTKVYLPSDDFYTIIFILFGVFAFFKILF